MKVLVTGGTGYLGAEIVRALARAGHDPVVFARRATASGLPGRLVDGDVRVRSSIRSAAHGVDAICHTAALVSIWQRRRQDFADVNVGGLRHVLDVARELGTPRIVYTSSFLALPPAGREEPLAANDYQRTKAEALVIARRAAASGLPVTTMIPGVIYGPGAATEGNLVGRMIRDHLSRRLPGIVGADRIWSFAYIADVAGAHVAVLTRGAAGAEYVTGGENAPQRRLFEALRRLRRTPVPRDLPVRLASLAGRLDECRARLTGRLPLVTAGAIEILRHDWPLDSRPSVEAFDYSITPLEAGLEATLAGTDFDGRTP
jgi:nucleoside-diphosphate-sugar epimerase